MPRMMYAKGGYHTEVAVARYAAWRIRLLGRTDAKPVSLGNSFGIVFTDLRGMPASLPVQNWEIAIKFYSKQK